MTELVDDGLVRAIGLSNYGLDDVERCHAQRHVDAIQDGLNLIDYLDHHQIFERAGQLGIAVTVYDSLSSGVLTDRTREEVLAAWEVFRGHGWSHPLLDPDNIEFTCAVVEGLRPLAKRLGATVAQVAIAWVLVQPGVASALAGTQSPRRVVENAAGAHMDVTSALEERSSNRSRWADVRVTGCARSQAKCLIQVTGADRSSAEPRTDSGICGDPLRARPRKTMPS